MSLALGCSQTQNGSKHPSAGTKVAEGVGWREFKVGATRDDLIHAFGKPDSDSTDRWIKWKKYHIHCLIDENRGAFELRFDDGFKGHMSSGIKIGSTVDELLSAYGNLSM